MVTKSKYWREILLGIAISLFTFYFSLVSFLRYTNFYAGKFDLGNMSQTVWNTLHGRFFLLTDPNGTQTVSRLATHADFILVLLTPLYALWSDPRMLLLIQVVIVALGAIFVYLLGKKILNHNSLALIFALLYLLNPSIERSIIYDFHSVVLATTFLLGAFYFMLERKYAYFLLFALLAGITKEQVWVVVSLLGLYIFLIQKNKFLGSIIAITSFVLFYYLFTYAIPHAAQAQHFALSYYSDYGVSPSEVVKNILKNPVQSATTILAPTRQTYLWQLFSPLALLSFASPLYLLFMLPELGLYLLSKNANLYQIYYQYTATLTPFIFISALYGLSHLRQRSSFFNERNNLILVFSLAVFFSYIYSPLPFSREPNIAMFTAKQTNREAINSYLENIPSYYKISASNSIGSHLTNREHIYTIPQGINEADLIIFKLNDGTAYPSKEEHLKLLDKLKQSGNFTIDYAISDLVSLKRVKR